MGSDLSPRCGHMILLSGYLFGSSQLIITWMSNTKEVPMVMVLLSYFLRYGVWRTDVRTNNQTF